MSSSNVKCTPGNFESVFQELLHEYGDKVVNAMDEVVEPVAKNTVKEIRSAAKGYGWKKYQSSWTSKKTISRRGFTEVTIYSKTPGLPHLLEKGHAMRNGGRTRAYPHIAEAASAAEKELTEKAEQAVRNA